MQDHPNVSNKISSDGFHIFLVYHLLQQSILLLLSRDIMAVVTSRLFTLVKTEIPLNSYSGNVSASLFVLTIVMTFHFCDPNQ